jgi:hypothetical protein
VRSVIPLLPLSTSELTLNWVGKAFENLSKTGSVWHLALAVSSNWTARSGNKRVGLSGCPNQFSDAARTRTAICLSGASGATRH